MEKNQYIVALEIGSSKIVGAIAEKTSAGYLSVKHLQEERHLNSVRYGIVQNVENIKSSINRILKNLEGMVDGRITQVYMGVSGRSLHSIVSEVNRSVGSTEPITKELIDRIIHEATSTPIRNHDTIDIVPRTFYVDKVETINPVGQFGSSIKIRVNLIVAKPSLKLNLNRLMTFGIPVKDYIVTPLAVAEQILSESDRELGCMLVDMGAETTTVAIYRNKALIYLNTLPLGGRNLTRDVMTGLNVLEETAENVKKNINNPLDPNNVSNVVIEGLNAPEAANYISARTGEIIANINQQLANAGVSSDQIQSIVLIGGGAHLGGLQQKLAETIKIRVRMGQNPPALNILNPEINRMEYIEVFSLLAKAADMIEEGETCIELNKYDDPTFDNPALRQYVPQENEVKNEPVKTKKPEKKNRWKKWTDKLSSLMSEDDNDEEQ
ncbi:MAG: cell division protein FtsA [Muribaculaceae bacterium]|jgi:cell division protein FtsA|nr:cell division protein FtsA [Muribaculaceae bacterium]